jgi:Cys-rich repeat protein
MVGADCGRCEAGEICHPELRLCVACMSDGDCAERPAHTRCDPSSFECVECTADHQCPAGKPVCLEGACRPCEVEPGACKSSGPMIDAAADAGVDDEAPSGDKTRPRANNGRHRGSRGR